MIAILAFAAATVVIWAANVFGFWWVAFAAGIAIGFTLARHPRALLVGALAGALGWGLPLLWLATSQPVGKTAEVISGVLGTSRLGGFPAIAVTVLVGLLLGVTGSWLGAALRRVLKKLKSDATILEAI